MRLVIVRHSDTDWTLTGRYTGTTDVALTADGRHQAASLSLLLHHVLHGQPAMLVCSPRRRATETAALALPGQRVTVDPLVAEYDYDGYEGMTAQQIHQLTPGWDIWRDGCPGGESTAEVSRRADAFLDAYADVDPQPLVVVTHGHFSRILAARSLRLPPEDGRLFASAMASVSLIEDHHGERCVGLWNADAALIAYASDRTAQPTARRPDRLVPAPGPLP